jgi:hypothetical protein
VAGAEVYHITLLTGESLSDAVKCSIELDGLFRIIGDDAGEALHRSTTGDKIIVKPGPADVLGM